MNRPPAPPPMDVRPDETVETPRTPPRGRLVRKYAALVVALVACVLILSGGVELYYSYRENKQALVRIQREQARGAAAAIAQFVGEIEGQLGWTTHSAHLADAESAKERHYDFIRLLRQVPAIAELRYLDANGREQLYVSRLAMDRIASNIDFSAKPQFRVTRAKRRYTSPVYFRKESEPFMTIAVASTSKKTGVIAAEVNLKFIWDAIARIQVGKAGRAYVIDRERLLIAHRDISLVLRKTDLSKLPRVRDPAAHQGAIVPGLQGGKVLSVSAPVPRLPWRVYVDLPRGEAYAPIYASLMRSAAVMAVGIVLAILASLLLARTMTGPIRLLRQGAARIGGGALDHRIEIKTGDELEALAGEFNRMAGRLKESHATLEHKVDLRTRELSEALEQQTATAEILRVISNSLDNTQPVFDAIVQSGLKLFSGAAISIALPEGDQVKAAAVAEADPARAAAWRRRFPIPFSRDYMHSAAILDHRMLDFPDVEKAPPELAPGARNFLASGYRAITIMPMMRGETAIGALSVVRPEPGPLSDKQLEILRTFASQAVIAIENTRLLNALRERSSELARSVAELKALGEVGQAVNSSLDSKTVLGTILAHACEIADAGGGAVYTHEEATDEFALEAAHGMSQELMDTVRQHRPHMGDPVVGACAKRRAAVQVADMTKEDDYELFSMLIAAGYRALLAVPLLYEDKVIGALIVRRKRPGAFAPETVGLLESFATQSAIALRNARLFRDIEQKSHELEIASQHKSQFLANMSHELRTPLNAILGYTELILDEIYGPPSAKMREVLERVETNGRHLLGLINEVLDLSKIEAGELELSMTKFAVPEVVNRVVTATESLAAEKKLALNVDLPPDLPTATGDERRIVQVLLNLVGNAIKFTDAGSVEIGVAARNGALDFTVADTGPGIAPADQERVFQEFQQVDFTTTKEKGGTGLGLAIAKRIIDMHGGHIWVDSTLGEGSTFGFSLPLDAEQQQVPR